MIGQPDVIHNLTFGDISRENKRNFPNEIAVVCAGRRFTFTEFDDRVNRLANVFRSHGMGTGGRVLWLGQNCHKVLEAILAAAKLGAVLCIGNWRMTDEELESIVRDFDPAVAFWDDGTAALANQVRDRTPKVQATWIDAGASADPTSYEGMLAAAAADDPEDFIDPALPVIQLYTAAFTGQQNGALLTQWGILVYNLVYARMVGVGDNYSHLNSGPLFHLATLSGTLATFHLGGKNVFIPRADPQAICEAIDREGCIGGRVIEPTISAIVEINADGRYDLSTFRSRPGRPEWNAMTDPQIRANESGGYGLTQATGRLCLPAVGVKGGNGRPHAMARLRILDEDGAEVPDGELGEISLRGPVVIAGYANRPELQRRVTEHGWFRTGDLGRREDDGSVTFTGTKMQMIKSGAENIYPAEVEACIASHPAVAECALIGVPDPVWVQSPVAIVALETGMSVTETEIREYCRERLASYKKPRRVEFVDVLPKSDHGVDYDALNLTYGGGGYPGSGDSGMQPTPNEPKQ